MEKGNLVPDVSMNESAVLMNTALQSFDGSCIQYPQVNLVEAMKTFPNLGLKLSQTPSFLEKVNHQLSQRRRSKENILQHANKLKAENFNISSLRIGQWKRVSRNECDLVGKCYFAKRKLVWEFLENGLKRKIEIQWSDILSLRAVLHEGQPGILELELTQPPLFFHEQDPQPRKHTQWKQVFDFTGRQALNYRRHYLEFPPGALDRPLEKLLSYDTRLNMLSRQGFPTLNSPFFPNQTYGHFSLDFGGELPITPHHHHQQLSFANVPTHYQTFEPTPLNTPISVMEFSKYRRNQMPVSDGQGRVMNVGDAMMMPVMPPNAATSISFQNNDLPPSPQSEFEGQMFQTLNDQRQIMLLNNIQANLFLQGQLGNSTNDAASPSMVDNSVLTNNVVVGGQMNHVHPVMNWTPDDNPFSSSVNSDDPFNHEINNWSRNFSPKQWQ